MDRIVIRDITLYAYHGVFAEERKLGQEFRINVELLLPTRDGKNSDRLDDAVDYAGVLERVKDIVLGEPCRLLETLAEKIAWSVLEDNRIKAAKVTVGKPSPPLPDVKGGVEVTIRRRKKGHRNRF